MDIRTKKQMTYNLSLAAIDRLSSLSRESERVVGHIVSRSKILDSLILNTGDPIARKKAECRELCKKINDLQQEIIELEGKSNEHA